MTVGRIASDEAQRPLSPCGRLVPVTQKGTAATDGPIDTGATPATERPVTIQLTAANGPLAVTGLRMVLKVGESRRSRVSRRQREKQKPLTATRRSVRLTVPAQPMQSRRLQARVRVEGPCSPATVGEDIPLGTRAARTSRRSVARLGTVARSKAARHARAAPEVRAERARTS